MSDVSVDFLLSNLKQHLVYDADLIMNVRDEVNGLISDLPVLKALIEVSTEIGSEDKVVKGLVSRIRPVIFEAEDAIDDYILKRTVYERKSRFEKLFPGSDMLRKVEKKKVEEVAKKVEAIREKVESQNPMLLTALHGRDRTRVERRLPEVEKKNVVGFDEAATTLIDRLIGETKDLQVISIIGTGGLGKTTLAGKVYNDPRVVDSFSTQAWIYVSQTYSKRDLLLSILRSGNQATYAEDERSLVQGVRAYLSWKYLILVDDVWDEKDWDDIKEAFPNHQNGSRILLTSRNKPVAEHADPHSPPHELDFLTHDQSWELLQTKVFGREPCPQHLRDLGVQIATKCDGLPIAVVAIAGILQNDKTTDAWETIAKNVQEFLVRNVEDLVKVLALSYHHLPTHLKACFLYLGVFQEDHEIPVWILIRLWIAEGFVQTSGSLEEMAQEHLSDLVARNLLIVEKRSLGGRIKTCHMHDLLRDFCLKEARADNFLLEIKEGGSNSSSYLTPVVSNINRRLCIHSGVSKYIASRPSGSQVRSFLCFSKDQDNLPREHVGYIPDNFKLLKVYHIQPIIFYRFPGEIQKLVHLTYVAFSGDFTRIPASMSELRNLQTLIAETSSRTVRTIHFEVDVQKMLKLRHLHTNKAIQWTINRVAEKSKNHGIASFNECLQTLTTITPESCTENILGQTAGLKKLGIRGKLATFLEEREYSPFDYCTSLEQLVTLKLFNDVFPYSPSEHKLLRLPQWDKFPPNLGRLTFQDTFLDWSQMHVLGMLPNLEELKLRDNAFTGHTWDTVDGGFKNLRGLQIWRTDLQFWLAKEEHFPRLEYLFLKDCIHLGEVPSSLGNVETLRTIKLSRTSPVAAASARRIKKRQQESKGLKIEIFPPDLGQDLSPGDYSDED